MQLTFTEAHSDRIDRGADGCHTWTGGRVGKYGCARVGGRPLRVHRAAYAEAHGPIPDGFVVDHICHNTLCVNPAHLRLATPSENSRHRQGARRGCASGVRGVTWNKKTRKWRAVVWVGGRNLHLGYFTDRASAASAAEDARRTHFGDFAGGAQ